MVRKITQMVEAKHCSSSFERMHCSENTFNELFTLHIIFKSKKRFFQIVDIIQRFFNKLGFKFIYHIFLPFRTKYIPSNPEIYQRAIFSE